MVEAGQITNPLMLDNFDAFKLAAYQEYTTVSQILNVAIHDDPVTLTQDLTQIETYGSRISYLLHKANGYLDKAEAERLLPKSKDYTDMDREKHLAAACAKERLMRDLLEGCAEGIKSRLMLGMTLLGVIRAEIERGIRQ